MAGRKRRLSNSTVETVDDRVIKWNKESAVLKKASPKVDSNYWPCFVLSDAVAYHKDGRRVANILKVDLEGPLILRGKLEIDESDQVKHLVKSTVKSAYIEIQGSTRYSIGLGDPPYPVIWASGDAGWFEIRPAHKYQATYNQMCEAIILYYAVVDVYDGIWKKSSKIGKRRQEFAKVTIDNLLFKYAVSLGDGVVLEEAKHRCRKHAQFLLAHFHKDDNAWQWQDTSFCRWMREQHADLQKKLEDASAGKPVAPETIEVEDDTSTEDEHVKPPSRGRSKSIQRSKRESEDFVMLDAPPARSSRQSDIGRDSTPRSERKSPNRNRVVPILPPLPAPSSSAPPLSRADSESAPANHQLLANVINDIGRDSEEYYKLKQGSLHARIYYRCRIKVYNSVSEITKYYAKQLLPLLDAAWAGTPYQQWLEEEAVKPAPIPELIPLDDLPRQLERRGKQAAGGRAAAGSATPGSGTSTPRNRANSAASSRRGSKNILQLQQQQARPRRSGKAAGLRLASVLTRKRPRSALDDEGDGDEADDNNDSAGSTAARRGRKTAKTSHFFGDDSDEDSHGAQEEEDEDDDEDNLSDVELDSDEDPSRGPRQPVRLVVRAEALPTSSPQGPEGTWTCGEEGCGYVVRSADDEEGKAAIARHFAEHEEQASRIGIALDEGSRGHMPISHLLEKIRALGEKAEHDAAGDGDGQVRINGQKVPQAIKRRLLI